MITCFIVHHHYCQLKTKSAKYWSKSLKTSLSMTSSRTHISAAMVCVRCRICKIRWSSWPVAESPRQRREYNLQASSLSYTFPYWNKWARSATEYSRRCFVLLVFGFGSTPLGSMKSGASFSFLYEKDANEPKAKHLCHKIFRHELKKINSFFEY